MSVFCDWGSNERSKSDLDVATQTLPVVSTSNAFGPEPSGREYSLMYGFEFDLKCTSASKWFEVTNIDEAMTAAITIKMTRFFDFNERMTDCFEY